jgi:2-iminobutanoate/2-iminopropanoate deaminase
MIKPIFAGFIVTLFGASVMIASDKEIVRPTGTKPGGSYSPGILVDGTLYVSGQGGEDATGKIPADFEAEVKQCLNNIGEILKTAGMSPADVVSVQVYLSDACFFKG